MFNKIILLSFIPFGYLQAQDHDSPVHKTTPIPVEIFAGNNAASVQLVVAKQFNENSNWGYFNVTNFKGDLKNNLAKNEFFTQSLINYKLFKGLSLTAGLSLNQKTGFRKEVGFQYVFANKKWLMIAVPTVDLKDSHNLETFSLLEFKPKLTNKLGLYTRLQGLYVHNPQEGIHEKSYLTVRVGLSVKNCQFGLGADSNWYGPHRVSTNNMGIFARIQLN